MSISYRNCTIFVGIDQSLNSTGYYIRELAGPGEHIADIAGLIKPGDRRGAKRLAYIFDYIEKILSCYTPEKVIVCMEGYAYNYRKGMVFELGEAGGIVKLCCHRLGIACLSVPPTELKKFVTGKGAASKEEVMKFVGERQNDIADAKGLSMVAKEIALQSTTERKKLEVIQNCLMNSREEVQPKKYTRKTQKNKKLNQTAGPVRL